MHRENGQRFLLTVQPIGRFPKKLAKAGRQNKPLFKF